MEAPYAYFRAIYLETDMTVTSTQKEVSASGPSVHRDPICTMIVDPETVSHTYVHHDHNYAFCSAGCRQKFVSDPEAYVTAKDPVCGMTVDRASAKHIAQLKGEHFYFCSLRCQDKFEADPEHFLDRLAI